MLGKITLHPLFTHAFAGVVEGLPPELSPNEVDGFFDDAVELFRLFSSPAKKSLIGLWGELLVILASPWQDALLTGWHVTPRETFDFIFPFACMEVKTTSRHNRQHEFTLEQMRGNSLPAFVASIVVDQSDAGETVFELATAIQEDLTPHNRAKLWKLIAQSLGSDADSAIDMRFIRATALNSLQFYDMATLPAPEVFGSAAQCISSVRFCLDLDRAPGIQALKPRDVWRTVGRGLTNC